MGQQLKTDWTLFGATIGMVAFGMVILYSASSVMAELKFGSDWHFVLRQCLWMAPSLAIMMALKRAPYRKFQNPAVAFAAIGLVLILLAIVFFMDSAHASLELAVAEQFDVPDLKDGIHLMTAFRQIPNAAIRKSFIVFARRSQRGRETNSHNQIERVLLQRAAVLIDGLQGSSHLAEIEVPVPMPQERRHRVAR